MPRTRLCFVALVATFALATSACLPQRYPGTLRWSSCRIPWFDAMVPTGTGSPMAPYIEELSRLTGMRFVPSSRASATYHGLLIKELVGGSPTVAGETNSMVTTDDGIEHYAWISLRRDVSPGLRRHELGHMFNLAHHASSPLMNPTPQPDATYSRAEISTMRDVAVRSGCL